MMAERFDTVLKCGILLLSRLYYMRSVEIEENHIVKYLSIYGNSFMRSKMIFKKHRTFDFYLIVILVCLSHDFFWLD